MGKPFSLQSPEQVAKEYGGNKQKIAQAAQMGQVDPTAAVLAGMFIDRMRSAQSLEQGAQPTVAQQVLAPPAPASAPPAPPASGAPPMGMAPPMAPPPMAPPMAPQAPPMGMASGGLTTLPIPDNMFDEPQYGGGGIVAFAEPGEVKLTDEMLIKAIQDPRTPENEREAARQELQRRRGPISDYGTPRTAEDTRAAFAKGLPKGLAEVGGALGSGLMNSEFAKDVVPAAESLGRGAVGVAENYSKGYGTLKDAMGEAGGWLLGTDYKSRDQREAEAPPAAPAAYDPYSPATQAELTGLGGLAIDPRRAAQQMGVASAPAAPAGALLDGVVAQPNLEDLAPAPRKEQVGPPKERVGTPGPARAPAPRVDQEVTQAPPGVAAPQAPAAPEKDYAALYADAMAAREGYPTLPAGESIADQKKQDFNMALADMGLRIAAGTSPNALVNITGGAAGALPGMQKAMDRRRESQRDAEKADFARREAVYGQKNAARTEALGLLNAGEERKDARAKLAQDASEGGLDRESKLAAARIAAAGSNRQSPLEAAIAGGPESPAYKNYAALVNAPKDKNPTPYEQGKDMMDYVNDKLKLHLRFDSMSPEEKKQLVDMYKEEYLKGVGSLAASPDTATDLLVKKYGGA